MPATSCTPQAPTSFYEYPEGCGKRLWSGLCGQYPLAAKLVPDAGVSWLLPCMVGRARALQMMMLGERLDAGTAEQWGLIYRAVEQETLALTGHLAKGPTQAYALIRLTVRASMDSTLTETLMLERRNQLLASRTAILQRESPRFGTNVQLSSADTEWM